jgi:GTP-binding protein HflX
VGFIDRLPHALVAAFRATLEAVADADLILHVIDASAADRERRIEAVRKVLEEVGASDVPMVEVYNKCDTLTADERRRLQDADPAALSISATNGDGIDELVDTMTSRLALDVRRMTLIFDPDDPADRERMARVYRHARVLEHESRDNRTTIVADVPRRLAERVQGAGKAK